MSGTTSTTKIDNAGIPQPGIPFLNADGTISRQWLYFLVSVFTRTGGSTGISANNLQNQVLALFVQEAMDDPQTAAPRVAFSLGDLLSDDPPPARPSFSALLAATLADDVPRAPLNPFLAAFVVADAA